MSRTEVPSEYNKVLEIIKDRPYFYGKLETTETGIIFEGDWLNQKEKVIINMITLDATETNSELSESWLNYLSENRFNFLMWFDQKHENTQDRITTLLNFAVYQGTEIETRSFTVEVGLPLWLLLGEDGKN